jgi:hypothetical protein
MIYIYIFFFAFSPPLVVATEEVVTAESVDGAIQQVVSSGGQQVITIVTDGIQLGNLHSIPTSGMGQPIIVTMPDGQQGEFRCLQEVCLCSVLRTLTCARIMLV